MSVRRDKASFFSGCNSHLATVAPASSNRSGSGGDEAAEAFDAKGRIGDSASRQAVTRVNAEQASKQLMREPTLRTLGEGRRRRLSGEQLDPCDDPAGVVATACLHRENERNTGDLRRWRRAPTGRPRGTGRAVAGVGKVHSTVETG